MDCNQVKLAQIRETHCMFLSVCVCERERECICLCLFEYLSISVSVYEREGVCVQVLRESVCLRCMWVSMCEREGVCICKKEREYMRVGCGGV